MKGKEFAIQQAADAETDRKMREAAKRHQKTRVGGGKRQSKSEEPEQKTPASKRRKGERGETMMLDHLSYKKGGTVRGAGCAKRGVRKPKMR